MQSTIGPIVGMCALSFIAGIWYARLRAKVRKVGSSGIEFVRRTTAAERELLTRVHATQPVAQKALGRISWTNLFVDGRYMVDLGEDTQAFDDFVRRLADEVFPTFKQRNILSVSFVTAPALGTHDQQWHIDYKGTEAHILVALTPFTTDNATQTLGLDVQDWSATTRSTFEVSTMASISGVLDSQGVDFCKVTQLVCREFSVLCMKRGTIHRGIANRGSTDRVMLCILVDEELFDLAEGKYAVASSDLPSKAKEAASAALREPEALSTTWAGSETWSE
jgi:hypothetical protein